MRYPVGTKLAKLEKGPITRLDLVKYAGASGDFNPIHTIEEFAHSAGLSGVIAHGMLSMAYVGQMITDFAGLDADLVDFGVRFRAMVRPGDQVICEGTVAKVEEQADGEYVYLQVNAQTQEGQLVIKGNATLKYGN